MELDTAHPFNPDTWPAVIFKIISLPILAFPKIEMFDSFLFGDLIVAMMEPLFRTIPDIFQKTETLDPLHSETARFISESAPTWLSIA